MALPWKQVVASQAYQALTPQQQSDARAQYFQQVVAPHVPTSDITKAWGEFTNAKGDIAAIHATMPQSLQSMVQSRIHADAQAASTPQANAARFQQINAQNVAAQSPLLTGLQGIGESFVNNARGVGELTGLESKADVSQSRKQDAALDSTAAGKVGNFVGQVAQTLPLGAVGGVLRLGELPLAARIGAGALAGAGQGLIQPVTSGAERTANVVGGALMGGAIPGVGAGLRTIGHGIQHLTNIGAVADRLVARRFGNIAADLRGGAGDPVPGVIRTPAQAVRSPAVMAEERTARSGIPGAQFFENDTANDAARVAHLRQFAGDESTLGDALNARGAMARNFVANNIGDKVANPSGILDAIKAVKRGTGGSNPGVQHALRTVQSMLGDPDVVDADGNVPLSAVESLRQSLGAIARSSGIATASPASAIRPVIAPVRDAVHEMLTDNVPGIDQYLSDYRSMSEPVNTMRGLQGLLDPKNMNADGSLSLARVNQFLKRDDKAPFGIAKDARNAVENVRDSLANETAAAQKIGPTGSNTNADALRSLGAYIAGNPYGVEPGPGARIFGGALGAGIHPFGWLAGEGAAGAAGRAIKGRVAPAIASRVSSASALADALDRAAAKSPRVSVLPSFLGIPNARIPLSFAPVARGIGLQMLPTNGGQ